ncbi:hypothetical protein [Gordonia otitidis]|uniref:Uncharacterized protein n=1 Tax=Gordonia otitidis (strain DSM 44809 / CCUG 52243 / JCM 12355 / NBRC 100426 / IFM 10032) TaxID=1108044 RepID=H5THI3_GORO1|nr:hypothetical protein [Gordonia otitidis]GAB32941.1 hypothetical protein GOOTI_034_00080 [Gordonia otitidis NBRC 100426]
MLFVRGDRVRVVGGNRYGYVADRLEPGMVVIDLPDGDRIVHAEAEIEHLD